MIFTIYCNDGNFEHNIEDVENLLRLKSPISELYRHIEITLNLDNKKFDYFIDYPGRKVVITANQQVFKSNLRENKLSDILNLIQQ